MGECKNSREVNNCKEYVNKTQHYGTKVKYEAVEKYVEGWFEKTKNNYINKNEKIVFNYIDVFSGSGFSYDTKNKEIIEGSIARVIKIFKRKALAYQCIDFNIIANDRNSQFCKCIKCFCKSESIDNISNLNIEVHNKDYKDFITNLDLTRFKTFWSKKININLIFYDPYRIEFDWNVLQSLFSMKFTDILINHIYPNDTKRGIPQVKEKIIKEKYEQAYGATFDELLKISAYDTVDDKDNKLRTLFHKNLKHYSSKKCIGYAPVIRDKGTHVHVFDLVVASNTNKACVILKNQMYNLYKEWIIDDNEQSQLAFNLFDSDSISHYKKTEFNFRYDIKSLGKILITEFGGQKFTKDDFTKLLEDHEYLPTNCKADLKKRGYYHIKENMYIVHDLIRD